MRWRYLSTLVFFVFSFLAIVLKLFYWQIVEASSLQQLGQAQYGSTIIVSPKRGDILSSDGFPLATTTLSYLAFANPKEVKEKNNAAGLIAPLLSLETATVSALLNTDSYWVALKSHINDSTKKQIDDKNINGIGFQDTFTRFYPEASMAAQLIGFVGKDEMGLDKGYFGLEGFYDRQLKGRAGQAIEIHDALGRPVLSRLNSSSGEQDGRSLVLYLDRVIQYQTEKKLKEGVEKYGARKGMAIVMDPKTGGILAMASFPSFDERNYTTYDDLLYRNPIISDTYEPGSTFKPLIMAGALNSHLVTPQATCPICSGPVTIGDYTIHTWNDKYYPNNSMMDIIRHSDNTGMVYVSKILGLNRMLSYMQKFGIGDTTGIDLQGEFAPPLKNENDWYPIDTATASFGQGISITPIELIDAFSALANNGKRMEPHIVKQVITPDGQKIDIAPKVIDQPVSEETAKIMAEILVYTVNKGEAQFARLKGYRIAGKTGTASIPLKGHYDPTKTIASFIGFAPADDPKYSMLIVLDQPTTSIYGAETAAPIFFDISKDILTYYGIQPVGDQ